MVEIITITITRTKGVQEDAANTLIDGFSNDLHYCVGEYDPDFTINIDKKDVVK